jgi:mannose-6-phosphate isomerase-like protein (cupin superfamily)
MKTYDLFEIKQFPAERNYELLPVTGGFIVPGVEYLASLNFAKEPIRYVAFLRLNEGDRRGNHYHLEKIEYLAVLDGEVAIELRSLENLDDYEKMQLSAGDMISIHPGCHHVVVSQTPHAIILEMATTTYDRSDVLYLNEE